MIFIISPNYANTDSGIALMKFAQAQGHCVYNIFNSWDCHKISKKRGIVWGEQDFCEYIAQEMRWNLHQNDPSWITRIPHCFVKRTITMNTIVALKNLEKTGYLDITKKQKELAPADGQSFIAGKYNNFPEGIPEQTQILCSKTSDWNCKYRFIIVNGQIVDKCCYKIFHMEHKKNLAAANIRYEDKFADDFIEELLLQVNCAHSCIIDIGYIKDAGWAVVGTYPIWSNFPYYCDPSKFYLALIASTTNTY